MANHMREKWAYCQRSGFKTKISDLVSDVVKGVDGQSWVDRRWADGVHPQSIPRSIGPDHMRVEPVTGNPDSPNADGIVWVKADWASQIANYRKGGG